MATPIYDHYFTAADVTVDMRIKDTDKRVNIDKAVAIAFTHNISSVPIYTLGKLEPFFFSRGNSIVQGQLDIAFKNTQYMITALNYLMGATDEPKVSKVVATKTNNGSNDINIVKEDGSLVNLNNASNDDFRDLVESQTVTGLYKLEDVSLINMPFLVDIIITFNNTNSNMSGVQSTITLKGVKFIGQSVAVNSLDDSALVDRFSFYAKNIQ